MSGHGKIDDGKIGDSKIGQGLQFKRLVELLPQIVWVSDVEGNIEFINAQWSRYTGLSAADTLGTQAVRIIHPEDRPRVLEIWRNAMEEGKPFEAEMRLHGADGSYEWFLSRCIPVYDDPALDANSLEQLMVATGELGGGELDGDHLEADDSDPFESGRGEKNPLAVMRWFGTSTNIHRRKQSEEAQQFSTELIFRLRQMRNADAIAQELVQELTEHLASDGALLLDYNIRTGATTVLAQYIRPSIYDSTRSAMRTAPKIEDWRPLGRYLALRLEGEDSPLMLCDSAAWLNRETKTNEPGKTSEDFAESGHWMVENQIAGLMAAVATRKWRDDEDNRVYLVVYAAEARRWQTQDCYLLHTLASSAWLAYQRSITEHALRQEQYTLELALEMAKMGTWEYDYDSRSVVRTPSLDRMFGISEDDLERSIDDYYAHIHPDDRQRAIDAVENSRHSIAPFGVEYRIVRPDDEIRWVAARGAVIRDAEGAATRLSGAVVDITGRKFLEAELRDRVKLAQFQARIGTALIGAEDLPTLLQMCTEVMVDAIGASFARIWTVDKTESILELQASAGKYTHLDGAHGRIPIGEYKIGRIAAERAPHLTNTVADDQWISDPEWARAEGMVGFAGFPLLIEGRVVGVMAMFSQRAFTERDLQAMAAVSNQIASTIERKYAEVHLKQSEERFRLALEDSPISVYTTDADLRYTWVFNPPMQTDVDEMLGRTDEEIFSPEGAKDLVQFKKDVMAGRGLMRRVVEVASRQQYARFDLSAVPIFDATGRATGMTVAATDITERERAEARLSLLAEASELLSASLDYSDTLDRLARAVVPRLADWCSVDLVEENPETGEQWVDQVVVAHTDPEMVAWARELRAQNPPSLDDPHGLAAVLRTGRPEFYPYISEEVLRMTAKSEDHFRIAKRVGMRSAMVVPLRLRRRILGAITLVWSDSQRNYTEADLRFAEELSRRAAVAIENARLYQEARQAESDLRSINENLEALVQERTAELERSNQELDRFAYVASHDLKAPLRAIEHLATWIEEDAGAVLPEVSVDHLQKMRGRIARMESLLDDLLTYSRAGRIRGDAGMVKTDELLHAVIETVSPPNGFEIALPDALPTLETYRAPLETVFRNLIGNAIKHHPQQNGRVEIAFEEVDEYFEFAVRDNGEGIQPQFHERIFEMFQTLRPRDHVEGSGIGLAVVKKIVESAGGTIRVESAPGSGAAFYFTWPKKWRG